MKYEWDENKNRINVIKHGFDFIDAPQIFELPMLLIEDNRIEYGEIRFIGLGILSNRFVAVIFTENEEKDCRRTISLRKATKNEREIYENNFQD